MKKINPNGVEFKNVSESVSSFWPNKNRKEELFQGISAKEFEKIFSSSLTESILKEAWSFFVGLFEKILHIKIFIEPPRIIQDINPELWPMYKKLVLLKERNLIGDFSYRNSLFNDEPKSVTFKIESKKSRHVSGFGKSFDDEKKAMIRALGEFVERYSLACFCPKDRIVALFDEIRNNAIEPSFFSGLNLEKRLEIQKSLAFQKNHQDEKIAFDRKTRFTWIKTNSFFDFEKKYVPFHLVSLHPLVYIKKEPYIRFPLSNGAAAGKNLEHALVNGILEVIERDAYMITWLNQLSPEIIDIETGPENLRKISRKLKRYDLELTLVSMPTDFEVPAILAIVIDRSGVGPAVVVGTKADFDLAEAVEGVIEDVIALRIGMRYRIEQNKSPNLNHLKLDNRAYAWYDLNMIKKINFLLQGERKSWNYFIEKYSKTDSLGNEKEQLAFLKAKFRENKLEAFWLDITAEKIKDLEIPAVMVVIPKMQSIYVDECFPYCEGERLKSIPEKLGFKPAEKFPSVPHPFA